MPTEGRSAPCASSHRRSSGGQRTRESGTRSHWTPLANGPKRTASAWGSSCMSLPGLLERGIEVVLRSSSAEDELRELVAKAGLEAEAAEHLRQTLEAIPSILVAITRDLSKGDPTIRSLFHAIVDYLIQEENLIPSHAGRPILGLLDDVYLVH